jgi:hypothetical protein
MSVLASIGRTLWKVDLSRLKIMHMDRCAIRDGSPDHQLAADAKGKPDRPYSVLSELRHQPNPVTFNLKDFHVGYITQSCGGFRHGIQNDLGVGRGVGDRTQDLADRSFLL